MLEQDIPVIFASVKEVTIMKTAVIYARVSSSNDRQNTQRQIEDLTQFASRNVAKLSGISVSTVHRIKKEFNLNFK